MIHQVSAGRLDVALRIADSRSAGIIRSDRDRLLILGGYMPTMFQAWMGYEPDPDFVQTLPDEHRQLLTGEQKFHRPRQPRQLGDPSAV